MERKFCMEERIIAWCLTLAMIVSMIPSVVFAGTADTNGVSVTATATTPAEGDKTVTLTGSATVPDSITVDSEKWTWSSDKSSVMTFGTGSAKSTTATISSLTEETKVTFTVTYEYTYTESTTGDGDTGDGGTGDGGTGDGGTEDDTTEPATATTETVTDTVVVTFKPEPVVEVPVVYAMSITGSKEGNIGDTLSLTAPVTADGVSHTSGQWSWSTTSENINLTQSTGQSTTATITAKSGLTATIVESITVTYSYSGVVVHSETFAVTFQYEPSIYVTYSGKDYYHGDNIILKVGDTGNITAHPDTGTVGWEPDSSYVTGEATPNNYKFTAESEGTTVLTLTHSADDSFSIKLNLVVGEADLVPTVSFTGSKIKTITDSTPQDLYVESNCELTFKIADESVVDLTYKLKDSGGYLYEMQGLKNGSTSITFTTTEARVNPSTTTVDGTASDFVTVNVSGIESGSGDSSGDSSGDGGSSSLTKTYVPSVTKLDDISLGAKGNYAERTVIVGAVQVDNGAESATSTELATKAAEYREMVAWKVDGTGSNLVELAGSGITKRFYYVLPGIATIHYWIDLNGNDTLDENEEAYSGKFTVTNTGIKVSETVLNMSTYDTSGSIYVFSYGDVGSISASSQNTSVVTATQTTETGTSGAALAVTLSTKSEVGNTTVIVTYSGGSESISVSVSDAVAGTITVTDEEGINANSPLYFSNLLDRMNAEAQVVYAGETLVRVQSLEVPASEGILHVGYQDADHTGGAVGTSLSYYINGTPSFGDIVFLPNANFTGDYATIIYTAYTSSGRSFYGEIIVYLSEISDVMLVTKAQTPLKLMGSDFNAIAQTVMAQNLSSLVFSLPDINEAILYYDYVSEYDYHHIIQPGEVLTLKELDNVTIVPSPGFGTPPQHGTYTDLNITYTATGTNNMVKTQIVVLRVFPYDSGDAVVYNTRQGEYLTLVTEDFHENSRNNTGNYNDAGDFQGVNMSYLTFTLPDTSQGVLYEDYRSPYDYRRAVVGDTPYYASYREPGISEVSFVPAEGFTGVVNIPFVGYDLEGSNYAGTLQINVTTHGEQDINYICTAGSYVSFYAEDFNQLSRNLVGNNLESITFTGVPKEYQGSLRLGQTPDGYQGVDVVTNLEFYRTNSPYIDLISFNSQDGFTGTVEIPFDGKSTTGQVFSAVISITVANQNVVQIPYSASRYYPVTFNEADFEKFSLLRTGSDLAYVRFNMPNEDEGTLYYDYTSLDTYEALVDVDTSYYSQQESFINLVSFVPAEGFVGSTTVEFTAWGQNGQDFVGYINIMVAESADPLHYQIHTGEFVYLNASAMNIYTRDETGSNLDYMTIGLPADGQGVLYHEYSQYTNESEWVQASSSTYYYRLDERNIADLAFVSDPYFIGTVELPFVGVSESGLSCSGTIKITVLPREAQTTVEYFTNYSPVLFQSEDIANVWNGTLIDYMILHNLPTEAQGKLYYENNLTSFAAPGDIYYGYDPSRGKSIDSMIFVPTATFTGDIALAYTAVTVGGTEFTGEIIIHVNNQTFSQNYVDMLSYPWAISSADYLHNTGVSIGIGENRYGPDLNITRGDFALMLQKAFRFLDQTATPFNDVSDVAYYYGAVTTMRGLGVVAGDDANNYYPNSPISRQDAMIMLSRAMVAAGKSVPSTDISVLYRFNDVTDVYQYAAAELSRMVLADIVSGDDNNCLNPKALLSRAEMAVIMHKAMTY